MAEYTDEELKAALQVGTGTRFGLDSRVIKKYKEVQIHGPVSLSEDVACVYVHPRHAKDRSTKKHVERLCARHGLPLIWIEEVGEIPPVERPEVLARRTWPFGGAVLTVIWKPPKCHTYDELQITHYCITASVNGGPWRFYSSNTRDLAKKSIGSLVETSEAGDSVAWNVGEVSFRVTPGSWVCQVAAMADGEWMSYSESSEPVLV